MNSKITREEGILTLTLKPESDEEFDHIFRLSWQNKPLTAVIKKDPKHALLRLEVRREVL